MDRFEDVKYFLYIPILKMAEISCQPWQFQGTQDLASLNSRCDLRSRGDEGEIVYSTQKAIEKTSKSLSNSWAVAYACF